MQDDIPPFAAGDLVMYTSSYEPHLSREEAHVCTGCTRGTMFRWIIGVESYKNGDIRLNADAFSLASPRTKADDPDTYDIYDTDC